MSEAKWTPGPWTIEGGGIWNIENGGPSHLICQVASYWDSDWQSANAHLIASAPALVEALEELDAAIDDGLCNSGIPGFDSGRLERARLAARAALALAKGGQS